MSNSILRYYEFHGCIGCRGRMVYNQYRQSQEEIARQVNNGVPVHCRIIHRHCERRIITKRRKSNALAIARMKWQEKSAIIRLGSIKIITDESEPELVIIE